VTKGYKLDAVKIFLIRSMAKHGINLWNKITQSITDI